MASLVRPLVLGLLAAASAGCLILTDESSLGARWTVNGTTPTAASCAALGVETVRLTVFQPGSTIADATMSAACSAGVLDSRSMPGVFLSPGDYEFQFAALRGGAAVATNARTPVRLALDDHTIVTTDFTGGAFDPRGTDASVEASWTVAGQVPTAALCSVLGIARVRVAIQDGANWYEIPALSAPCAQGRVDTRPSRVLRAGRFTLQVQGLDAAGTVIAPGEATALELTAGAHVVMTPLAFSSGPHMPLGSDATVSASWRLNSLMPTRDSCYAIGADRMRVSLYALTDTTFSAGTPILQANCATGALDSGTMRLVRAGFYRWSLEALDEAGELLAEYTEMTPVAVAASSRLALPVVDFSFPTTLTIDTAWVTPGGTTVNSCAGAGVQRMSFELRRGTTVVSSGTMRACADILSFDAMTIPTLTAGEYQLAYQGFDSSGRMAWATGAGSCPASLGTRALVATQCVAGYTP